MLRLSLPKEPYWMDLPRGVRVKVRPCTSAVFYEARAFMKQELQNYRKDTGTDQADLSDLENDTVYEGKADCYLTLGLARAGIMDWEGVFEADSDNLAPVTNATIDQLFEIDWLIAETFKQQYITSRDLLEAEKNDSGSSLDGTLATERPIAKDVPSKKELVRKAKKPKTDNTVPISNTAQ